MNGTASHPISLPDRVVVFDYGEVISVSPSEANRAELLATAGLDPADADGFWRQYWAGREELDAGSLSIADYWAQVAEAAGMQWPVERLHAIWAVDFVGWLGINPDTMRVIEDLAAGGTRLALLSNAGPDFSSFFRSGSFGPLFEHVFVSGELSLVKPDAAIYRHAIDALGIEADRMVFVDNKAENVAGATALGITGHVFTSPEDLRAFLTGLAEA